MKQNFSWNVIFFNELYKYSLCCICGCVLYLMSVRFRLKIFGNFKKKKKIVKHSYILIRFSVLWQARSLHFFLILCIFTEKCLALLCLPFGTYQILDLNRNCALLQRRLLHISCCTSDDHQRWALHNHLNAHQLAYTPKFSMQ